MINCLIELYTQSHVCVCVFAPCWSKYSSPSLFQVIFKFQKPTSTCCASRDSRAVKCTLYTLHTPRLSSLGAHGLKCELLSLFLLLLLLLLLLYGMPCNCFDFSKSTITNADSSWSRSSTSLERFRYCLNATVKKKLQLKWSKVIYIPDRYRYRYICMCIIGSQCTAGRQAGTSLSNYDMAIIIAPFVR